MPADEKIAFTLSPEAVGSDGGGRFTLAYDDASVPAELTTDPPRLTWGTEDGTAHLFTVLGPSDAGPNWLWFDSLWLSSWGELADMVTDIRFLTCKVTN